jgi:hypothetical protein
LELPEQLFEIRWQGRGGSPNFVVEVNTPDRKFMIPCTEFTTLWELMEEIEWQDSDGQIIVFSDEVKITGYTEKEDDLPLNDYFNRCTKGLRRKIDFTVHEIQRPYDSEDEWNGQDDPYQWVLGPNGWISRDDYEDPEELDRFLKLRVETASSGVECSASAGVKMSEIEASVPEPMRLEFEASATEKSIEMDSREIEYSGASSIIEIMPESNRAQSTDESQATSSERGNQSSEAGISRDGVSGSDSEDSLATRSDCAPIELGEFSAQKDLGAGTLRPAVMADGSIPGGTSDGQISDNSEQTEADLGTDPADG